MIGLSVTAALWLGMTNAMVQANPLSDDSSHEAIAPHQDASPTGSIHERRQQSATTTSAIPLTTTFIPPDDCNNGQLTMLSSPGYFIWLNEPVPVSESTFSSCYPSEFMKEYQTYHINPTTVGSRVPLMSPLICPFGWETLTSIDNYIACCPTNFLLSPPETTMDANRPAYGGTCYSDWTLGQTASVSAFGSSSYIGMTLASAKTVPFQVYAHVIDGIVATATQQTHTSSSGSDATSTSTSTSTDAAADATADASTDASASSNSSTLSGGAVAGIVIGSLAGCAIIIIIASFFIIRRRKLLARSTPPAPPAPLEDHKSELPIGDMDNFPTDTPISEMDGYGRRSLHEMEGA
ncbi:hypothetical protein F5X96DRAFT_640078 [Biscogniauxia mediterranea]|nr:hypothetical protein F5X96DRAFT_640078 [Biscogniauxia mediterranea]